MTESKDKRIQMKEPTEITVPAEQTKPGPVFVPAVDIFEDDTSITLLGDIPGTKAGDLRVDLHDNILTLDAEIPPLKERMKSQSSENTRQAATSGSSPCRRSSTSQK